MVWYGMVWYGMVWYGAKKSNTMGLFYAIFCSPGKFKLNG
jgi:hypothetical protein